MIFTLYRIFDLLLLLYFFFLFPDNGVIPTSIAIPLGWFLAALIIYRVVKSLLPSIPNNDSYVFDLVDCTHHHFSSQEKEDRINHQG